MPDEIFCCAMRRRFVVNIVAEDRSVPEPPDLVDHLDFDHKTASGKPIIRISFCPFCGQRPIGLLRFVERPEGGGR